MGKVAQGGTKRVRFHIPDFSTMSFEIVTIRVGKPAVDIPVYKDLICSVAPYFSGAFNNSFRETEERAITLQDVSEATFRIFLKWCHSQLHPAQINGDVLALDDFTKETGRAWTKEEADDNSERTPVQPLPIFDAYQDGGPLHFADIDPAEYDRLYYKNPHWLRKYRHTVFSLLRLYSFADKYCVEQLRDDIMSAFTGYIHTWQWWPDPDLDFISMAYETLPSSSLFLRLLVLGITYCWSPPRCVESLAKLEALPPKFLFDVMVAQAQRQEDPKKGETEETKPVPGDVEFGMANSCCFHEHLVFDKKECRQRLANCTSIFKGLIDGCLQEAECAVLEDS